MSIPANPERDTDLIIDRALMDATQAGAALRAVLAALDAPGIPEVAWFADELMPTIAAALDVTL